MSSMTSGAGVAPGKLPLSRVLLAGVVAIVGSLVANLIVFWLGGMIAQPNPDFQPLASPRPTIIRPTLTAGVFHSLLTVKASRVAPTVIKLKEITPRRRGVSRS